jgi:antitoxin (DNA-binding transcriptional repressor) of toxin-antitoxin stability system
MKTVGITELKARLSEHLNCVRKGRTLTVLDRETPVALNFPPPPASPTDSLTVLLDDRRGR